MVACVLLALEHTVLLSTCVLLFRLGTTPQAWVLVFESIPLSNTFNRAKTTTTPKRLILVFIRKIKKNLFSREEIQEEKTKKLKFWVGRGCWR